MEWFGCIVSPFLPSLFAEFFSFKQAPSTFLNEFWRWTKTSDTLFMLDYERQCM